MIDPISAVSGSFGIALTLVDFFGYVRRVRGADVVSAYFKWDGTRLEGSDRITVEKHPNADNDAVWWFAVKDQPGYVFVRMPVIESCAYELVGMIQGEKNPDSQYWRWVAPQRPGVIVGGQEEPPNVKVDFIVVGYRPQALIKHFSRSK